MADYDEERMQNLEDILNEKDSDDDDDEPVDFNIRRKGGGAQGMAGTQGRKILGYKATAQDKTLAGGAADFNGEQLEDIEREMYEKYGVGSGKPRMADSAAAHYSEPLDSARGIVGKDDVAYSKQQLLEDSDSDSAQNSARKLEGDRGEIDDEFKKIFGDNYDFSKKSKAKKGGLSSSESSVDSTQNQRYKDIEKVIREGDDLIQAFSKPQSERPKPMRAAADVTRGTMNSGATESILRNDEHSRYNQSVLSTVVVKDIDFLNLDEGPADIMLSTFKGSAVEDAHRGTDNIEESQVEAALEDPTHILSLIEKNEKLNEAVPDEVIQESQQLLSLDKKFYNVESKLLLYEEYHQIARKLQAEGHKLYGVSQCIGLLKNFMFIGNNEGIIRVFDVKTQKEMMPLMDHASTNGSRVTSMDIHQDGLYLMSGHRDGSIALWDLREYRLLKHVPEIHQSDVTNVKIYDTAKNNNVIYAVSSEDQGGVRLIQISKKALFGGYSVQQEYLFKSKMQGTTSISIQEPNPLYPNEFCDNSIIVAFGALNMINICTMDPIRCIYSINRPEFCRATTLPYIDWGYGLTPSHRDQTVPIFAFAWDRIIQLVYITNDGSSLEIDGIYYTDAKEIIGLFFIGESILYAIFENNQYGREGKVLYTTKFYPGSYRQLEEEYRFSDQSFLEEVGRINQMTMHAELEKTYNAELKQQMVDLNEFRGQMMQTVEVVNYQNSIQKHNQNLLFLGQKIIRGRVFSWREYIEEIDKQVDWMSVLKIAMEIYNGDLKGYAKLSDQKEIRERQLLPYMQELIKRKIEDVLQKLSQRVPKSFLSDDQGSIEYSPEQVAINVAIEFCLNINATEFLFNDIFFLFAHSNLKKLFIKNLEPFLMSGKFREHKIDQGILNQLILQYQSDEITFQKLKSLEKIVQQLEVNQQLRELQDRTQLEIFCEKHHLITALLSLKNEPTLIIRNIFIQMQKILKKEQQNQRQGTVPANQARFDKQSMYQLNKDSKKVYHNILDPEAKYSCERSFCYLGYKVLWIMNTFLKGRNIPYGNNLPHSLWQTHVYQIANLLAADDNFIQTDKKIKGQQDQVDDNLVKCLLKFDAPCFFGVITRLFSGEPYCFIIDKLDKQCEVDKFPGKILKNITGAVNQLVLEQNARKDNAPQDTLNHMFQVMNEQSQSTSSLRAEFQHFVLKIFVEHQEFQAKLADPKTKAQKSKNSRGVQRDHVLRMVLEPSLVFESIRGVLKDFKVRRDAGGQTRPVDELDHFLVQVIKDFRSSHRDLETVQKDLTSLELDKLFINLRVQLYEGQDDYIQSFHLQMNSDLLQARIFIWIEQKFKLLDSRVDKKKTLSQLKSNVAERMRELIDIDAEKTMHLIEEWFDDEYAHKLIHQDLKDHKEVLYKFLTNFIEMNDVSIKITIDKQMLQNDQGEQAEKYKQYLFTYLELMCDMFKNGLQGVTHETIEQFVEKPYLPTKECMEICKLAQQERAIAALQVREHQFVEALDTYNCYLDKFDLICVGEELCRLIYDYYELAKYRLRQKDPKHGGKAQLDNEFEQQFLEDQVRIIQRKNDAEPSSWTESLIRTYQKNWAYEECYKYPKLSEFDYIIRKMCEITKKVPEKLIEKAFFIILQPLGQMQKEVFDKIKTRMSEFQVMKSQMKIDMSVDQVCSIIEDFIDRRKNAIIENHIPWQISPQKLIQTVDLDLKSIITFFKFKMIEFKSDIKFRKGARKLLLQEYITLFEVGYKRNNYGRCFNNKPMLIQGYLAHVDRPELFDYCQVCSHSIIGRLNKSEIRYFQFCDHKFHQHCLNSIKKETLGPTEQLEASAYPGEQEQDCPQCALTNPTVILKDLRTQSITGRASFVASSQADDTRTAAAADGLAESRSESKQLMQSHQSMADSQYTFDGKRNDFLKQNQLEQFDMILSQSQLFNNDFYEDE